MTSRVARAHTGPLSARVASRSRCTESSSCSAAVSEGMRFGCWKITPISRPRSPVRSVRDIDGGVELAIIAQGSFGAREMGYSSDADVQFIAVDRGAGRDTVEITNAVATQIQKILNAPVARSDMKVSADLRPEGKVGPLTRTAESWIDYLRRDAETWEKQALLRARVGIDRKSVV